MDKWEEVAGLKALQLPFLNKKELYFCKEEGGAVSAV